MKKKVFLSFLIIYIVLFDCTFGQITKNSINYSTINNAIIEISGRENNIQNNDNSPNMEDNTLFGDVFVSSGSIYKYFKIKNIGADTLKLNGSQKVYLTGKGSEDFNIPHYEDIRNEIAPGSFTFLRIDFNPSLEGLRFADVVIENNDINNNPFIFTIAGQGLKPFSDSTGIFQGTEDQFQAVGTDGSYIGFSTTNWGDYDSDGNLDLILTGYSNNGFITNVYNYKNDNTFKKADIPVSIVVSGDAKWFDYDNDNDLDLIVSGRSQLNQPFSITKIFKNNGNDDFVEISNLEGMYNSSMDWGDIDNDGDLDIIIVGYSDKFKTKLYKNNGDDSFSEIATNIAGISNADCSFADYDSDGDLDIIIVGRESTIIYRNDENYKFTDIEANIPGFQQSSVIWFDFDNDNDFDIAITGSHEILPEAEYYTKIYRNEGNDQFVEVPFLISGFRNASISCGDYDNDGNLDLVVSGLSPENFKKRNTVIYRNINGENFIESTNLLGLEWGSTSWGDYDNDGDLDLMTTGDFYHNIDNYEDMSFQISQLYENKISQNPKVFSIPTNLNSSVSGNNVHLSWEDNENKTSDQGSLTFNVYIGTEFKKSDVISPMADMQTGKRKIVRWGNANFSKSLNIQNLQYGKTYYWGVQSINNSFEGSPFSVEKSFHINSPPTTIGINDIVTLYDSNEIVINLENYFDDVEDGAENLSFIIADVFNTHILDSLYIENHQLIVDTKENSYGVSECVIRAIDNDSAFVETRFKIMVFEKNDVPVIYDLPDSVKISDDKTRDINLFSHIYDKETDDVDLIFNFSSNNDSLLVVFNSSTGVLSLSKKENYTGIVALEIIAFDQMGAMAKDTVMVICSNTAVDVDKMENNLVFKFKISQNYPNPFNPSTQISYSIARSSLVDLRVYDILGREVAKLVNETQNEGNYTVNFDAKDLSSGIYIYTIRANDFSSTKKMVLLR